MNTDRLIAKARHALETGQPNLANLYLRKALEQTEQHRQELNPIAAQARRMRKALQTLGEAIRPMVRQYLDAIEALQEAVREPKKSDFALVGENHE